LCAPRRIIWSARKPNQRSTWDLGDRYYEADTLVRLGDTHLAADNPDGARTAWQRALDILTELDHPDADTVRAKHHGLDQTEPEPATTR
jgi:hypothetical protein